MKRALTRSAFALTAGLMATPALPQPFPAVPNPRVDPLFRWVDPYSGRDVPVIDDYGYDYYGGYYRGAPGGVTPQNMPRGYGEPEYREQQPRVRDAFCNPERQRYCPPHNVAYNGQERAGSIIISTSQRALFYVLGDGEARRYTISVGRDGQEMESGQYFIYKKTEWPEWRPTQRMLAEIKNLPRVMPGGPKNPLGSRALYLANMRGEDESYRIHGTNQPKTIGAAASAGCFRMMNADVEELYDQITPGRQTTRVIVQQAPVLAPYKAPNAGGPMNLQPRYNRF